MVQAQLLKFFIKKTKEGMIFPWLEFKDIPLTQVCVTVMDWDTVGELISNFERTPPPLPKNMSWEPKKHSLRNEAH